MNFKLSLLAAIGLFGNSFTYGDTMSEGFEKVMHARHSGRTYDESKQVPEEHINKLIEAARHSPSCFNDQPWHYIIGNKSTHLETYQKIFDTLVEVNQGWAKNAPVLMLAVAGSHFNKNGKPNRHGQYDTGAASMSLVYQATELGLMAHQMAGFDDKKASATFEIPSEYVPMAVIAIGYEAKNAPDKEGNKDRKPVDNNFYFNGWKE